MNFAYARNHTCKSAVYGSSIQLPVPRRFEPLRGASSFIGRWRLYSTTGPQGYLTFLKSGDVELRSPDGRVLGLSVAPWTYVSPSKGETTVRVSFSIDADSEDGVLYFQGTVDSAGGATRELRGTFTTAFGKKLGDFTAEPIPE